MSSRPVDRAVSSTFSEILIVAVVVASVTLIGTFVLANAQNDVSESEDRLLDATIEVDGEIALSHRGGESFPTSELRLIVRNESGTVYNTPFDAGRLDGPDDGSFDIGDTARFNDGGLPSGDIRVLLVHDPTQELLATERFFGASFVAGVASASITNAPIGDADAGNTQAVTVRFTDEMDRNVAPTVEITGLSGGTRPVSGSYATGKRWEGDVTIPDDDEETTATIEVSGAVDTTGSSIPAASFSFNVDTITPSVTVSQPNGGETIRGGSTYTIQWSTTASDVQSNSVDLAYSTDGGSTWTDIAADEANDGAYDWSVPSIDSASVRVRVNVTDDVGNVGADRSDADFEIDSTAPGVASASITNAPVNQSDSGAFQTITVNFDEAMNQSVEPIVEVTGVTASVSYRNGQWVDATTYEIEASVGDNDEDVTATISVSGAVDGAGNTQSPDPDTSNTFEVDTRTPVISNFAATNPSGQDVEMSFDSDQQLSTISVDVNDDGGNNEVTLTKGDFTRSGSAGSYTYTATFTASQDDTYDATLNAAADGVGNDGGGQTDSVVVDSTPPNIDNPNPADGATVSDSSQTYTVDITDVTTGIDESSIRVTVTEGGGSGTPLYSAGTGDSAVSFSGGTLTIDGPTYVDGQVEVTVDAADNAGNAATFSSTFTVRGNDPPTSNPRSLSQVGEGFSITLDGTGSTDSDGSLTSYSWAITSGMGSITEDGTGTPNATYVAPDDVNSDQTVTIELTVTDGEGATDSQTIQVTVVDTSGASDPGPSGSEAFNDANNNGVYDSGETSITKANLEDGFQDTTTELVVPSDVGTIDAKGSGGGNQLQITAKSITLRSGVTTRGGQITLKARNDIDITGQTIDSNKEITIRAGESGSGRLIATDATIEAKNSGIDLRSRGDMYIDGATIDAGNAQAEAKLQYTSATIFVGGATIIDDNDDVRYQPAGATKDSTAASGSVSAN